MRSPPTWGRRRSAHRRGPSWRRCARSWRRPAARWSGSSRPKSTWWIRRSSTRSDTGPACTAPEVRDGLPRVGGTTRFLAPGSPWESGSGESCTGTRRDEGRDPEIFTPLPAAQIRIQRWRLEYNQVRPHSALGARPPAPDALEIRPPTPRPLGRPEGRRTPFSTGTTNGGRSGGLRVGELGEAVGGNHPARRSSSGPYLSGWSRHSCLMRSTQGSYQPHNPITRAP